jgi:hypothetical protein
MTFRRLAFAAVLAPALAFAATPAADPFGGRQPDLGSLVFTGGFAITPGTALPFTPRAIYIGGGSGGLVAVGMDGQTVTFAGLVTWSILPFRAVSVATSGTTATNLVGLY